VPTGPVHVAAALAAIVLGGAVLRATKGTRRHVLLGRVFVAVMAAQLAAALATREQDQFGPFHVLAVVSAFTVGAGWLTYRVAGRGKDAVRAHGLLMIWAYAGLVAAGAAQLANDGLPDAAPWPVVLTSLVVVGATAVLVRRHASVLDRPG
jgi:uncharacterized membrane protein